MKEHKDYTQFSVSIPTKDYKKLVAEAKKRMLSISAVAREKMLGIKK